MSKLGNLIEPIVQGGGVLTAANVHESLVEMTLDALDQVFTDTQVSPQTVLRSLERIAQRVEEYQQLIHEQAGEKHGYRDAVR